MSHYELLTQEARALNDRLETTWATLRSNTPNKTRLTRCRSSHRLLCPGPEVCVRGLAGGFYTAPLLFTHACGFVRTCVWPVFVLASLFIANTRFACAEGLPLSVLMSLFDDVSTWPCIAEDKQMRPGVSVHLSAELTSPTSPIKPDTDLLITARPLKIGRTLAFLSLECRDANTDQLYATGRHTKYLPMGFIFETAFTHFMPLLELYAKVANPFGKQNHDLENRTTFPNIKDVVGDINAVKGVAEVKVNKQHLNPMGGLHGGCQSVLAELVGTQTLQVRRAARSEWRGASEQMTGEGRANDRRGTTDLLTASQNGWRGTRFSRNSLPNSRADRTARLARLSREL